MQIFLNVEHSNSKSELFQQLYELLIISKLRLMLRIVQIQMQTTTVKNNKGFMKKNKSNS